MASNIKPDAVASQPGGVASKPAVYVKAFDSGLRGFAYEFKAPCGCRHWSTGKFEYCPGHHTAVNSHAALVQALAHAEVLLSDQIDKAGFRTDMVEQYGKVLDMIRAARKLAGEEI
jgi:hypothetical protein